MFSDLYRSWLLRHIFALLSVLLKPLVLIPLHTLSLHSSQFGNVKNFNKKDRMNIILWGTELEAEVLVKNF